MTPVSFAFQNKTYNDAPAFRGKYEVFWKNYNRELNNVPLRDTILKSINNESNFLGEGHTKKGYILEGLKNYVIRIFKNNFKYKDLEREFSKPDKNYLNILEEVIANIPGKIDIVKRKKGKPLGVPKYSERIEVNHFPSLSSIQVTREETLNLLNIYNKLKSFPLRSYVQAYRQLKKFCKQPGFQFDIISPNNLLIDTKSKKINIIDPVTPEVNEPVHGKNTDFSKYHGCDSLYPVLCDFIMQEEHLANLTPEEAIKWKKAMNTIISKCIRAGEAVGLERNLDKIRILYNRITKFWRSDELCQRFDNFIDMYSGSTKKEQTKENALNYKNDVRTRMKAINKLDAPKFNDVKPIFEKIIKAEHQPKVEFPEILNAALEKIIEYREGTKSILPMLEELFNKEIFYPTKKRLYRLFILTKSKNKRFWEEISKSAANPFEKVLYSQEIEELLKTSNSSKKKTKDIYNNYMHGERVTQELVDKLWISRSCLRADETQKISLNNMAKAYQYIEINKNQKLETNNLVELHKILLAGNPTREHIAGKLRTPETDELVQQIFKINKNAPKKVIHEYSEPKDVVQDLKKLNQYISKNSEKMDIFELAANIFSELTRIHPFIDGNGRVTRLFTEHFLLGKGYRLMKWPEETLYRKIISSKELAGYLKQNCVKE